MNCLEFRRLLGSEPLSSTAEFVRHRHECARCADAAARAADFEAALRRALHIDAAPQFAESILLAQATRQNRHHARLRRGGLLAVAAMLVLAVGIGMHVEAKPLSTQAVDHLVGEAVVLTSTVPVSADAVRAAFAQRGIALKSVPDRTITFVGCCPMGRHRTVHLVMTERNAPDTVNFVVDRRAGQREDFERDGWRGRAVPLGTGTLVLLAHGAGAFDDVEALWRAALSG